MTNQIQAQELIEHCDLPTTEFAEWFSERMRELNPEY